MKKCVLLALVNIVLAVTSANAQSRRITINIPFDFVVGDSTFRSGVYTITSVAQNGSVILLRSAVGNRSVLLTAFNRASQSHTDVANRSNVVFKKENGVNYLWRISTQGYDVERELPLRPANTEVVSVVKDDIVIVIPRAIFP
jgi:hypothetical protein